ncbi:L-ascorbate metabolism protein UlaG (beta-lactamase superfamily) [Paenibacillus endophyticus]|uniref:L-ascorbate metabolism protein UlaG (Beta-lactamase superfamily) n=1 Tax=Paenibacillus endophyticus TaxID=1294268 RepID=A0A7W5C2G2_9BACL|nr:MBL fold metallo-hydrolase [Paenibacillus endophyticus]MBB3150016.1 L-ascorbate metabolism protein UlaG (beta-lactamase superfamily) [Paenibacillus endophyticus]
MNIQKLPWAGIRVELESTAIAIDPLYHFPEKLGEPHESFFHLEAYGPAAAVLITHQHPDHFDPRAIIAAYGSDVPVFVTEEIVDIAVSSGLTRVTGLAIGVPCTIGPFTFLAAHAVDGSGDPQVSWIVRGGGKQIIHAGDTLWHGYWWKFVKAFGKFDVACLPVNGAVTQFPGVTPPSDQPICLTPEQAVTAAEILGAKTLIPIHYKAAHHPPIYTETSDIPNRLAKSGQDRIQIRFLQTKEVFSI